VSFSRVPRHRYSDPLDEIWVAAAAKIGFGVARTPDAYASTDGRGTILVGTPETLDPDDSLAQMIFHELCHALVEGEQGERKVDWGLSNEDDRDVSREHACLRLQAHLAARHGLRDFLAPTTDYRAFWETLGADPFESAIGRRDPSAVAARLAAWRAARAPYAPHLDDALARTAAVAAAVVADAPDSLWKTAAAPPPRHAAKHDVVGAVPGRTCGGCTWRARDGKCLAARKKVAPKAAACVRWEPRTLDCLECGACCREAYHAVDVGAREPVIKRHPELIVVDGARHGLRRAGDRCAALLGGHGPGEPYTCRIYADRPRTCRDFTLGSANCLDARRRVGLSL
jgi:hypothetical protein